jgi:hypothetical protein
MSEEKIKALVLKYNQGLVDDSEKIILEQLLDKGAIQLEDLLDAESIQSDLLKLRVPSPSNKLNEQFYDMLKGEIQKSRPLFSWKEFFTWPQVMTRLAFTMLILITGVAVGRFFFPAEQNTTKVEQLTGEISDLKEMVMLSLLEKDEATERLRAVSLTEDMSDVSSKVAGALFQTLNNDENVNVRLAALEALKPYVHSSEIREQLVHSIAKQESPLVQVALAELMGAIQEKSSVSELKKIVEKENTPTDIKKKIQETINVMI